MNLTFRLLCNQFSQKLKYKDLRKIPVETYSSVQLNMTNQNKLINGNTNLKSKGKCGYCKQQLSGNR